MANSILGVVVLLVVVTFSGLVGEIFGFVGYYLKSFYGFVYEFFGFLDNIFWISQPFFGF